MCCKTKIYKQPSQYHMPQMRDYQQPSDKVEQTIMIVGNVESNCMCSGHCHMLVLIGWSKASLM